MKYAFAAVYVLVLATQLPHIWWSYASLENPTIPLAQWTALGAALAFELSIGVFTYRIVKGSRRRWTKRGLMFFIVASVVANGYYYGWWPFVFGRLMPAFATVALPFALALFAEEFGAEVKRDERAAKRELRKIEWAEFKPESDVPDSESDESATEPAEPSTESPELLEFASKADHIRHLLATEPGLTQAEVANRASASASYVSEVVRSNHR